MRWSHMENNSYEYVMLIDRERYGTIIRCQGRYQYEYDVNTREWVRSGILIEYQCDESPLYDMYKEISEDEVMKIIKAS